MSGETVEFEALLRRALAPIDPPEALVERLEHTLTSLTEAAAEELESWELASMRDPRNWVRPAAAVVVGSVAGSALVLVRVRQRQKRRRLASGSLLDTAERALADVVQEARRLLDDGPGR